MIRIVEGVTNFDMVGHIFVDVNRVPVQVGDRTGCGLLRQARQHLRDHGYRLASFEDGEFWMPPLESVLSNNPVVKRVVFVGGPFSADTPEELDANIVRIEMLAHEVAAAGAAPVVPNSLGRTYKGHPAYEFWIEATKVILRRCDALLVTPDWERSAGTRGEVAEARDLGMPVFYNLDQLKTWLAIPSGDLKSVVTWTATGPQVRHPTSAEQRAHRKQMMAKFGSLKFVGSREEANALCRFMSTRDLELSWIIDPDYDDNDRPTGLTQVTAVESPKP